MDKIKRTKLKELLRLALKSEGAQMGVIRSYDPDNDELFIVSHYGFSKEYLDHFYAVKPFDGSCCGRTFGIGSTVIINDIEQDLSFKKQIKIIKGLNTEFRALKCLPILTSRGRKIGVFSSHFTNPKWEWQFNSEDKI